MLSIPPLVAATAALIASLATVMGLWLARHAEQRRAYRELLLPLVTDIGEALHQTLACSRTVLLRKRSGKPVGNWSGKASAAADRLIKYDPRMETPTDTRLREMTDTLVREVSPLRVLLFGSWARGTATADSDVDLIVVEDEPFSALRSRRREMARLWRLLAGFAFPKDILVYSAEEFERFRTFSNHVVARAICEGRILCERG